MDIYTGGFPNSSNSIHQGPNPFVTNLRQDVLNNTNFFTTRWTGLYMQMGLMTIPVSGQSGLDMFINFDQIYYIEQGLASVAMGTIRESLDFQARAYSGFSIFIPARTWNNVYNVGNIDLKMSVTIAPPFFPHDTNFKMFEDWVPTKYY